MQEETYVRLRAVQKDLLQKARSTAPRVHLTLTLGDTLRHLVDIYFSPRRPA